MADGAITAAKLATGATLMLRSGETARGSFAIEFNASSPGMRGTSLIAFPLQLATAPTPHLIPVGGASTETCPGTSANPAAAPGHLCVYETFQQNIAGPCIARTGASYACGVADPWGATLFLTASAPGQVSSVGSWAVSAP